MAVASYALKLYGFSLGLFLSSGEKEEPSSSLWRQTIAVIGAVAIPIILIACKRQLKKPEPEIQIQKPRVGSQEQKGTSLSNRGLFRSDDPQAPDGLTMTSCITQWDLGSAKVEVHRTIQSDIVVRVFDDKGKKVSQYYAGVRGGYSEDEVKKFIKTRDPKLVKKKDGSVCGATFHRNEENLICMWRSKSYQVSLVQRQSDLKWEWIISYIKGDTCVESERIPDWRKEKPTKPPNISRDENDALVVSFPEDTAPASEEKKFSKCQMKPKYGDSPSKGSVVTPKNSQDRWMIKKFLDSIRNGAIRNAFNGNTEDDIDNIRMKFTIIKTSKTILGYVRKIGLTSEWVYAPMEDGNIPQNINGMKFDTPFCYWAAQPSQTKGNTQHYYSSIDSGKRKYFLIPANGGWVPVRHGTDPKCGNWLSEESSTKIVYDSHRMRWPGCETIDYKKHGFVSDQNHKIWWPKKNDTFSPSFDRLKIFYYPCHQKLDDGTQRIWKRAKEVLAVTAVFLAEEFKIVSKIPEFAMKVGAAVLDSVDEKEAKKDDRAKVEVEKGYLTQQDVWNTLELQDMLDRGKEVMKSIGQSNSDKVQKLVNGGMISKDLRNKALIAAAAEGHVPIVNILLDRIDIDEEVLKTVYKAAMENGRGPVVRALQQYRSRERPAYTLTNS